MHNLNGAKVVFLDRDGTINVDHGFVCNLDNFELCEGAGRGLQILAGHFDLFVVTNQSGIGRAMYTLQDMHSVHTHMRLALKKYGVHLADVFYCPHAPDARCGCRKPEVGMIVQAELKYGLFDYEHSWMIGDKLTDISLGHRIGTKTALLRSNYWRDADLKYGVQKTDGFVPTLVCDSLLDAAKKIEELENG
jgi:D,D-heptose 1,7-bisphosphate phosphatase